MNILKAIFKGKKKKRSNWADYYQESINKLGKEQIRRLVDKGLNVPVWML